jgi:transcriptional regulator with XRE-family HTH domain
MGVRSSDPIRERGRRLKSLRLEMKISVRDVERYSRLIGALTGKEEYVFRKSSLSAVEKTGQRIPSINQLFSLAVIYKRNFFELLLIFGVDLDDITRLQLEIQLPQTTLVSPVLYDLNRAIKVPLKFDSEIDLKESALLSHLEQTWGEIPIGFLQGLALQQHLYGLIGTEDLTLHPYIRPGSLVQIDSRDTKIQESGWETVYDRPIYFLQLRKGYACGFCQLDNGRLSIIPFDTPRRAIKTLKHPEEVEVIGRVTGLAMSLLPFAQRAGMKNQSLIARNS